MFNGVQNHLLLITYLLCIIIMSVLGELNPLLIHWTGHITIQFKFRAKLFMICVSFFPQSGYPLIFLPKLDAHPFDTQSLVLIR